MEIRLGKIDDYTWVHAKSHQPHGSTLGYVVAGIVAGEATSILVVVMITRAKQKV